jgi:hypothetical protein
MLQVMLDKPTLTQVVPLHVVPAGHPQSRQHEAVVSAPLQMPSPQTSDGGAT